MQSESSIFFAFILKPSYREIGVNIDIQLAFPLPPHPLPLQESWERGEGQGH